MENKYTVADLQAMQAWPLSRKIQVTHPALYNYCMKPWENGGLGMKEPLEYIGIQTENKEANNDTFSK